MDVYTRSNGKRRAIASPRDLMNLKGEGTIYIYENGSDSEAARWAAAVLYHVKSGGRAIGVK